MSTTVSALLSALLLAASFPSVALAAFIPSASPQLCPPQRCGPPPLAMITTCPDGQPNQLCILVDAEKNICNWHERSCDNRRSDEAQADDADEWMNDEDDTEPGIDSSEDVDYNDEDANDEQWQQATSDSADQQSTDSQFNTKLILNKLNQIESEVQTILSHFNAAADDDDENVDESLGDDVNGAIYHDQWSHRLSRHPNADGAEIDSFGDWFGFGKKSNNNDNTMSDQQTMQSFPFANTPSQSPNIKFDQQSISPETNEQSMQLQWFGRDPHKDTSSSANSANFNDPQQVKSLVANQQNLVQQAAENHWPQASEHEIAQHLSNAGIGAQLLALQAQSPAATVETAKTTMTVVLIAVTAMYFI